MPSLYALLDCYVARIYGMLYISHCHGLHFLLFVSDIAMEYGTWFVSRNRFEIRIVEYTYIQRRIFHNAKKTWLSLVLCPIGNG